MTTLNVSSAPSMSSSSSSSTGSSISSTLGVLPEAPQLPFSFPKNTDTEAVWQKFLKDTAEYMQGDDPRESQVIFLGNIHTEKWWQKDWRGDILRHYGPDAIVLCEGFKALKPIPLKDVTSFTPKSEVTVYGWDDENAFKDNSAARTIYSLNKKYQESVPSDKWDAEDMTAWREATFAFYNQSARRTQSLIKTTKMFLKNLKIGQKLFVISGSDHLYDKGLSHNVLGYFKGTKVSMILPKALSKDSEGDYYKHLGLLSSQ